VPAGSTGRQVRAGGVCAVRGRQVQRERQAGEPRRGWQQKVRIAVQWQWQQCRGDRCAGGEKEESEVVRQVRQERCERRW